MEHYAVGSGDMDDEIGGCQMDRSFWDVDNEKDGEDQLDRAKPNEEGLKEVEEKRSLMDIIATR